MIKKYEDLIQKTFLVKKIKKLNFKNMKEVAYIKRLLLPLIYPYFFFRMGIPVLSVSITLNPAGTSSKDPDLISRAK